MKKTFRRVLVSVLSLSMIATLAFGSFCAKEIKANEDVEYSKWTFSQGGLYAEAANTAYIDKVTMNGTGEEITGWKTGEGSMNQSMSAKQDSDGFSIKINGNGWDRTWDTDPWRANPWSIKGVVNSDMEEYHMYKVSFKAKASKKKLAYVLFETDLDGHTMQPYAEAGLKDGSDNNVIVINQTEKQYTYTFTNHVSGEELKTSILLGAFGKGSDSDTHVYDYAGNDITSIVGSEETGWQGTVDVSDFVIEDLGVDPEHGSGGEKIETYLDLDNDDAEVNKEYKYYAYLYDDDDDPISGQTLTLTVEGKEYTAITDGNGCATFTLYFYSVGEHQFDVVYEGNDTYERCYDYEYIDVDEEGGGDDESEAYVGIPDYKTSVFVGEQYSLTAYLYDGYDDAIAGEYLNLYVDGSFYQQIQTNGSGAATFSLTFYTEGSHEITVEYNGSDYYEDDSYQFNLVVRKAGDNRTVTYIDDITDIDYVDPGERFSYGATLYDDDDNPISGKTIRMDINGESSGTAVTDANGEFSFDVCLYEPGEYQIDFYFEGDGDYLPCKDGCNIFVEGEGERDSVYFGHDNIRSIEVGKTFQYHVSLYSDDTELPLSGKTLCLSVDGEKEEVESVTNKDGEATFTLRFDKAGTHKIYVYFEGDEDYYGNDYEQRINAYVPGTVIPDNPSSAVIPGNTPTIQNKTVGKVAGLKAKNKKKRKAIVTWKKVNGAKKYQVKYAMNKKFKKAKTKVVNTNKIVFKKLKKKTYFFKVRGFSGTNYGAWSKAKKLKIKK